MINVSNLVPLVQFFDLPIEMQYIVLERYVDQKLIAYHGGDSENETS